MAEAKITPREKDYSQWYQDVIQRRTVGTLMAANAFGYAGFVAVAAVVALLASEMTGNDSIAGIPAAAATLGTAAAAAPPRRG